jgi:stress response protein YsnF
MTGRFRDQAVVVDKEVVPKERVRLDKDVVTEQQNVSTDLRKERIEVERDGQSNLDLSETRDDARG